MLEKFEGFTLSVTSHKDPLPPEFNLDFMIWQMAGGQPREMRWIEDNLSFYAILRNAMMRKYQRYLDEPAKK